MITIFTHADCAAHDPGPHHPECPERLAAIQDQIIRSGLEFVCLYRDAPNATRADLCRAHRPDYVERVFAMAPVEGVVEIDGDTVMTPQTLSSALRAAGAVVAAVDAVMQQPRAPVFCAVRPPGHHATRDRAMGFCLFNNVAVGACHALDVHKLARVAIVDFDAHHGNGTEEIFRDEPRILFCSSFQHPFYPYTGHEAETPNLIDIPLAAGTTGDVFRARISERWLPALERFRPQLILVSAGFDGHVEDDMSALALTAADYRWLSEALRALADRHAKGRIVSVLEGGYALSALGRSVVAHLQALLD